MLNRAGVVKTTYGNVGQILANVELQASVGCIVPQSLGVVVGSKKIAKAGTPIVVNFANLGADVAAPAQNLPANAILLHNVDVTSGKANGTALYFGVVNINRVDSDVAANLSCGVNVIGAVTIINA